MAWRTTQIRAIRAALAAATLTLSVITICAQPAPATEEPPVHITIEQASSRSSPDLAPAFEGKLVQIEGLILSKPIWAVEAYYVAMRDETGFGIVLQAPLAQLEGLAIGDVIEVQGRIQRRNGMPVLIPHDLHKTGRKQRAQAIDAKPSDLSTFRYEGLTVVIEGRVTSSGESASGELLTVADSRGSVSVFLPKFRRDDDASLDGVRIGDRVRVTGILVQDCPLAPYDRYFQLLASGSAAIVILESSSGIPAYLLLTALTIIAILLIIWWFRENRLAGFRRTMRTLNSLGEEVLAATSLSEILKKVETVVPSIANASGLYIYLYNRKTRMLEALRPGRGPAPPHINLDAPGNAMNAGVAMCFRNRTLLNIPDTRRSPFFKADPKSDVPRSVMFVPMFAQNELLGVLQVHRSDTVRYFNSEEQAAAQHLANQLATSLKLQEQRMMREQLFKSEKLAATGQLISEVANELKEPVETMLVLSQIALRRNGPMNERDLQLMASESQRTAEIVARLISFGRNYEETAAKPVEVSALLSGLFKFREREWKAAGIKLTDRLGSEPIYVIGSQGQLEQVFLNLLVHAEQTVAETEEKAITASATLMGRRVLVDISYSARISSPDPLADGQNALALGLGVARSIVQSHGGDLRFERPSANSCRFNVELPRADIGTASATGPAEGRPAVARKMTLLLVEPDVSSQRQAVAAFGSRGHRVVPVKAPEEAQDLVQRVRFDAVACSSRLPGMNWITMYQNVQPHVDSFILLTDSFDASLAQAFSSGDGFFLTKPLQDVEIDRVLQAVANRMRDSLGSKSA